MDIFSSLPFPAGTTNIPKNVMKNDDLCRAVLVYFDIVTAPKHWDMDKRSRVILAAGLLLFVIIFFADLFFFSDLYFSGIAAIVLIALGMSFFIMQDTRFLPEISVFLRDDAKGIVVINRGNDVAEKIHVAIVPYNIEFDISALTVDARYEYPHSDMISEAKAAVTYQNSQGLAYSQTFRLSALEKSDEDLLKPMFPMFKWK
jgi:hypothetical protein